MPRLARGEGKLAEAELTRKGKLIGKSAGIFGGSGIMAVYGVGCLLAAGMAGLATVLAVWLAALIAGAVLLAIAGLAALAGKRDISRAAPPVPEQTLASVKADAQAITERVSQ